jgi:hypothetical protein
MVFNFGLLLRGKFSRKEMEKPHVKKGKEEEHSRKYIKHASRTIKRVIREPDELPVRENVPAIKELFENGIESP